MRLKFDRLINITLRENQTITVPKNELWKFTGYKDTRDYFVINGTNVSTEYLNGCVVEGATFKGHNYSQQIQGIAFKVVE